MQIEQALNYNDNKQRIQRLLVYLREDLEKYQHSQNAKPEYIIKQRRMIEAIELYVNSSSAIIDYRQYVIYYTDETLRDERHNLYSGQNRDLKNANNQIAQLQHQVQTLRNMLRQNSTV